MTRIAHTLATVLLLSAVGCTGTVEDSVATDARGFGITSHTASSIAGSIVNEHGTIDFAAETTSAGLVVVALAVNGRDFGMQAEPSDDVGWLATDGGFAIGTADAALLQTLSASLADYLGSDTDAYQDRALIAATQYLAQFPVGTDVQPMYRDVYQVDALAPTSLGNNGISCIKKGRSYNASYDASNGASNTVSAQCNANWGSSNCGGGDYACMGRCGGGCSGVAWTLDCLEHDVCSHNLCAGGGGGDSNCGDEYWEAADDIAAFWCWG